MFSFREKLPLVGAAILTAGLSLGSISTDWALAQPVLRGRPEKWESGHPTLNVRKLAETRCAACQWH
jgi:hypothetical protein